MQELLTDDEVVALCAATQSSWPLPLLTVATDDRAVTAAAFRGLRALLVRRLATAGDGAHPAIEPGLAAIVTRAAAATRIVVAHVSSAERAGWAGAGVAAFLDDKGLILDVVNATGIHGLQTADQAEAAHRVAAFVQSRFEPAADVTLSPDGCILLAASGQEQVYRVRPGLVERGAVIATTAAFEVSDVADPMAVETFLARVLR